jgi:glycosyltransferase involved in cell wall biosynthesis
MKVLHVIPSLSLKHGGPSVAMPLIARSLTQAGVEVDIATSDDDGPGHRLDVPLHRRIEQDRHGVFYFRKQTEFYKVSLSMRQWLKSHVHDYDAVHIHALFSFSSTAAARIARRQKTPYIIRPLGVLNRWGMENRRKFLKALSFQFVERPILRHAAAVHYTSRAEQIEAEATGIAARAAVIPLGIDLAPFANLPGPERFLARWPQAKGREIVLFLSRLDPKKGLDLLMDALAENRKSEKCLLVAAGSGEAAYERTLHEKETRLGLSGDILWTGFLKGEEKLSALAAARIFVLPSHSENFGIALVEALAAGLPCITTDGVAVSEDIRERDAGLVVKATTKPLSEAVNQLLGDAALRARFSRNAKDLAKERFSLESMGVALTALYKQILSAHRKDA